MVLMWESTLYNKLVNDGALVGYVSTYRDNPSIFSDSAPENVDFPYIVFRIDGTTGPDSALDVFNVTIDYFDFQYSAKNSRLAIRRIVEILDREHLQDDYYKTIRMFKSWSSSVSTNEMDPRAKHYVVKFTARAGRKGWIDNLVTEFGMDHNDSIGFDQDGNPALSQ